MDHHPYYVEFGQRVRDARASRSQADIARAAGMTRAAIANIETGRHRVTLDIFDRLARALGVPPTTLLPATPADAGAFDTSRLKRSEQDAVNRVLARAGIAVDGDASG